MNYAKVLGYIGCLFVGSFANSQQPASSYQPFTPPVVGGLPPNSKGLEQPVYVADRSPSSISDYRAFATADLGFDAERAVPGTQPMTFFDAGTLIATVGNESITIGDLVPPARLTPQIVNNPQFEMALRKALVESVTRKSLAQKFINDKASGKSQKERIEAKKQIEFQTTKVFHEKYKPHLKKNLGIETDLELEDALVKKGQTLPGMQREFMESAWANAYLDDHVPEKPMVELSEMRDHYEANIDTFRRPARVRFQILSAIFSRYPNKQKAFQAIEEMWNEVYFGGASFEGVAKRKSTGIRASEGGLLDWTSQGSLKSKVIDQVIFEIPIRGLSKIFEDSDGYHVVEVLEREPANIRSFVETQAEIRQQLIEQKQKKLKADVIKKVRESTPVYTQWPDDIPGSQLLVP